MGQSERGPDVRLRVTLTYEYDTNRADYPDSDPLAMATYDLENDAGIVFDADSQIEKAEVIG